MIFVTAPNRPGTVEGIAKIRKLASEQFGRDPYSVKIIGGASFHISRTHDEALEKLALERKHFPDEAKAVGFSGVSDIDLAGYELDHYVDIPTSTNAHQTITKNVIKGKRRTKREILDDYDRSGLFVGTPEEISNQVE